MGSDTHRTLGSHHKVLKLATSTRKCGNHCTWSSDPPQTRPPWCPLCIHISFLKIADHTHVHCVSKTCSRQVKNPFFPPFYFVVQQIRVANHFFHCFSHFDISSLFAVSPPLLLHHLFYYGPYYTPGSRLKYYKDKMMMMIEWGVQFLFHGRNDKEVIQPLSIIDKLRSTQDFTQDSIKQLPRKEAVANPGAQPRPDFLLIYRGACNLPQSPAGILPLVKKSQIVELGESKTIR